MRCSALPVVRPGLLFALFIVFRVVIIGGTDPAIVGILELLAEQSITLGIAVVIPAPVTITAAAEAEPAARVRTKESVPVSETLLSTNTLFTLVPTNPIAVTALFVPREGTDFEIWAADRGIDTPWTTNPATGRGSPRG